MKACRLTEIGKIEYSEAVDKPEISNDEVLVKVKAAGICGSDVARVYKTGAHKMPLIIGHEFSGVVEETGSGVDKKWHGKRVGIFPLIPCKGCNACMNKKYEMCSNYSYLGSRQDGGFAEYVAVPEWNLIELPDEVSYKQAAMLEPMAVAVHAMRQLKLSCDSNIVVCGMGTIGQLLVMFLLESGIKNVLAVGNKEAQLSSLEDIGLKKECFFNSRVSGSQTLSEWLDKQTSGNGIDAYFECVGKNDTIAQAFDVVKAGGQVCLVGNPEGDISLDKDVYWQILRKQLTVAGTWNSSFLGYMDGEAVSDDWHYVLNCLQNGRINPQKLITHTIKLEELESGLEIMKDKSEYYTKIMVVD